MKIKDKFLDFTLNSINFKLIISVVIVQILSTNIGQAVNFFLEKGREALSGVGLKTNYLDGSIGFYVSSGLGIIITVSIIVFIYDRLVLKRLKKILNII